MLLVPDHRVEAHSVALGLAASLCAGCWGDQGVAVCALVTRAS